MNVINMFVLSMNISLFEISARETALGKVRRRAIAFDRRTNMCEGKTCISVFKKNKVKTGRHNVVDLCKLSRLSVNCQRIIRNEPITK